jgi:histone acetyltransferase 1
MKQVFRSPFLSHALSVFILQKQARRVYEILRLQMTDIHNSEQYRRYRLDVKNRLNIPYQVRGCTRKR